MIDAQLVVLKAAILAEADATFAGYRTAGASGLMSDWFNEPSATMIWRPRIEVADLLGAVVWADFIAAPVQTQNAWFALTQGGWVDATQARIRAGFAAIFGGGSASVTNLSTLARRPATRFEALFESGGVSSVFGARVSFTDIDQALALE